jgi:hypothetical protein
VSRKSIHDVSTRPVKAVRRRATLGLLPPELLTAEAVHVIERKTGALRANDYELRAGDGAVVMDAESRVQVVRGWRYDFLAGGQLRFSMERRKRLLVFDGLHVIDAAGQPLGEFRQEPTAFSVHFEVVDAKGQRRLTLYQPEDAHRRFEVFKDNTLAAVIDRTTEAPVRRVRRASRGEAVESFDLTFVVPLDELDRVFCLSAALFVDRLYFSRGDSTSDPLVRVTLGIRKQDEEW